MSADLAAWAGVALVVATALIRDGIRRGKIDTVLEALGELVDDLDDRVRFLEGRRPRSHRERGRHRSD